MTPKRLPMFNRPVIFRYQSLVNALLILTLYLDWDSKPLSALGSLYLIAVAPISPGVLHIIKQNKFIRIVH